MQDPFYHTYVCKDARPFYVVAPCHAGKLSAVLGITPRSQFVHCSSARLGFVDAQFVVCLCPSARIAPLPRVAVHQQRVLEALGVWDDMVAQRLPVGHDVYAESDDWGEGINCVLGTYPLTDPVWIHRIKSAMKEAFLKKPAAE